MSKRFKANGNGCPAFKVEEEVRYYIDVTAHSEDQSMVKTVGSKQFITDPSDFKWDKAELDWFNDDRCEWLEVQESDLPYLEKPDVAIYGETEFRKCKMGDTVMDAHRNERGVCTHHSINVSYKDYEESCWLSGYRWCKPRKVEVIEMDNIKFRVWCKTKKEWETDECMLTTDGRLMHLVPRTSGFVELKRETHDIIMFINDRQVTGEIK